MFVETPAGGSRRESSSGWHDRLPNASAHEECVLLFRGYIRANETRECGSAEELKRLFEDVMFVDGMARVGVCVAEVIPPRRQPDTTSDETGSDFVSETTCSSAQREDDTVNQAGWKRQPFLFVTSETTSIELGTDTVVQKCASLQAIPRSSIDGRSRSSRLVAELRDCWMILLVVFLNYANGMIGTFASDVSYLVPLQSSLDSIMIALILAHVLRNCSLAILQRLMGSSDIYFLLLCTAAGIVGTLIPNPIDGVFPTCAFSLRMMLFSFAVMTLDAAASMGRRVKGAVLVLASLFNAYVVGWNMTVGSSNSNDVNDQERQTIWLFGFFRLHALTVVTSASSFLFSYFAQFAFRLLVKEYDAFMIRFPLFLISGTQLLQALSGSENTLPSSSGLGTAADFIAAGNIPPGEKWWDVFGVIPLIHDPSGVVHRALLQKTEAQLASLAQSLGSPGPFALKFSLRQRVSEQSRRALGHHIAAPPRQEDEPLFSPINRTNSLWYAANTPRATSLTSMQAGAKTEIVLVPVRPMTICSTRPLLSMPWLESAVRLGPVQAFIALSILLSLGAIATLRTTSTGETMRLIARYCIFLVCCLCSSQLDRDLLLMSLKSIDFWVLFFQILVVTVIDAHRSIECGPGVLDAVTHLVVGLLLALVGASVDSFLLTRKLKAVVVFLFGLYNLVFFVLTQKYINDGTCGSDAYLQGPGHLSIHLPTLQQSIFFTIGFITLKFSHRFFVQHWQCVFLVFGAKRVEVSRDQLLDSIAVPSLSSEKWTSRTSPATGP